MPFGEHNTWDFFPRHLYRAEIMNPHKAIDDFFQRMHLEAYLEDLDEWLHAACADDPLATQPPRDFICLHEDMEKLLEAAWLIQQARREKSSPGTLSPADLNERLALLGMQHAQYYRESHVWSYFPRHLSREEFMNPYLAFHRFFGLHNIAEWRDELRMYFEAALSRRSVYEALGSGSNLHTDWLHLKKLVEAAFLIYMDYRYVHASKHSGTLPAC